MAIQLDCFSKTFKFNFRARTSRGLMNDKTSWFIRVWDASSPEIKGIGEAGPLPGLSPEAGPAFGDQVNQLISRINQSHPASEAEILSLVPDTFPSMKFALETALLDLRRGGKRELFQNSFIEGTPIPINGLIWMGDMDFMMNQINEKIALGFDCIKLKVGGLDFDRECDILDYIRKRYFRKDIIIRLDANGAFKIDDVLYKLEELSKYKVHSIEQPIKAGQPEMAQVCRKSPIPVALDEELIGKITLEQKEQLLAELSPQYIILKPTLLGGFAQCMQWIQVAKKLNVGWWITSALESNIGLNAIAQFTANYDGSIHHGLGTGAIYANNFGSPLVARDGKLMYERELGWNDELQR
jgi:o-succinylbenzoate synthase